MYSLSLFFIPISIISAIINGINNSNIASNNLNKGARTAFNFNPLLYSTNSFFTI